MTQFIRITLFSISVFGATLGLAAVYDNAVERNLHHTNQGELK